MNEKPKNQQDPTFYSNSQMYHANTDLWEKTLYSKLREIYSSRNLNSGKTLVIGASYGREVPEGFTGVLLDPDLAACASASQSRKSAFVVCADGKSIPFMDKEFNSAVISLVLSQLLIMGKKEDAVKVFNEALRVSSERVIIIDTTESTRRSLSMVFVEKGKPWRYEDETLKSEVFSLEMLGVTTATRIAEPFEWVRNHPIIETPAYMPRSDPIGVSYKVEAFEIMRR